MNAKELIGKTALREKPIQTQVMTGGGSKIETIPEYRYCTNPVKIVAATDHHIIIEFEINKLFSKEGLATKQIILDERFCDDNWTDYNKLIGKNEG